MGSTSQEIIITIRIVVEAKDTEVVITAIEAASPEVVSVTKDVPDVTTAYCRARPSIRTQQLPTIEEIREKLMIVPIYNQRRDPISAEDLFKILSAYQDVSGRGPWDQHESLSDLDRGDTLTEGELRRALKLLGLGARYVVFTRNLVLEAYRLSMHGLTAEQISDMIGIDKLKIAHTLNRINTRDQTYRRDNFYWVDARFLGAYGLTPDEYRASIV